MSLEDLKTPKIVLVYARPGHGKTTLIKQYLKKLEYHHLYILSASLYDDYTPQHINQLGINHENVKTSSSFNIADLEEFRSKDGIKMLVMDDVLHLEVSNGHNAAYIRDLFSTSRHHHMYIFIGVQLLKTLGKALRYCAHVFITGSIDEDSIQMLTTLSGKKRNELKDIYLQPFNFLCCSNGIIRPINNTSTPVLNQNHEKDFDTNEESYTSESE